jgi:peptidoglycan hydrolase-like protein with peptidoglycan-binding domain
MRSVLPLVVMLAVLASACSKQDQEERAREAAEKIKASIPDVDAIALAQKVSPADIKTAQEELTKLNEYQGEINGTLDSVTVNAIEAFQREHGLSSNGLLSDETTRLMREAAQAVKAKAPPAS